MVQETSHGVKKQQQKIKNTFPVYSIYSFRLRFRNNFIAVAAGRYHSLALRETVYTVGGAVYTDLANPMTSGLSDVNLTVTAGNCKVTL